MQAYAQPHRAISSILLVEKEYVPPKSIRRCQGRRGGKT